ncbi:hypothetical protein ACFLZP_00610 [Patescibacteria group bacterium]
MLDLERKTKQSLALEKWLLPSSDISPVRDLAQAHLEQLSSPYYAHCWQTLLGQHPKPLMGIEKAIYTRQEKSYVQEVTHDCLSLYQTILALPSGEVNPSPNWQTRLSHFWNTCNDQYAYLFLGRPRSGHSHSITSQLNRTFDPTVFLTLQATEQYPEIDPNQAFIFFLDLSLHHSIAGSKYQFAHQVTIAQKVKDDFCPHLNLPNLERPPKNKGLREALTRAQSNLVASQERRDLVLWHPERVAYLRSLQIQRPHQDNPGLNYWELYALHWGFNQNQQRYPLRQIAATYPFFYEPNRVRHALKFGELILNNCHPHIKFPSQEVEYKARALHSSGNRTPQDVGIEIRRHLAETKEAELQAQLESEGWRSSYRALAVCEFDLLLLQLFQRLIKKREVVLDTHLDVEGNQGVYHHLGQVLTADLKARYPQIRVKELKNPFFRRRLLSLFGLTSNQELIAVRDPDSEPNQGGTQSNIGLNLEDTFIAQALIEAQRTSNYQQLALPCPGTSWALSHWSALHQEQHPEETYQISKSSIVYLGKIALANLILAGAEQELLNLESRYRFRNPLFFSALKELDHTKPMADQITQALACLPLIEPGRFSQEAQRIAVAYCCRYQPFHLESFLLPKICQRQPATEICQKLGLSNQRSTIPKVILTETKKHLVRFPLGWANLP